MIDTKNIYWGNVPGINFNVGKEPDHSITYDVIIIGAGIIGLNTARILAEEGLKILVLDKDLIGGNSALSGGIISYDNELDIENWIREIGAQETKKLIEITQSGSKKFIDLLTKLNLDQPINSGVVAVIRNEKDLYLLDQEIEAQKSVGLHPEFLPRDALIKKINSQEFVAGYFNPDVSCINPFKALRNLASHLANNYDCSFSENTKVLSLKNGEINTNRGVYKTKKVIISAGPSVSDIIKPRKPAVKLTSSIVVTKPISSEDLERLGWEEKFAIWDLGEIFSYFRLTDDNRILYGPDYSDKFGDFSNNIAYGNLVRSRAKKDLDKFFGINVEIDYLWSGLIHVTEDSLPDFGNYNNNLWYYGSGATLSLGFQIGQYLADDILGKESGEDMFLKKLQLNHFNRRSMIFRLPLPIKIKESILNTLANFYI